MSSVAHAEHLALVLDGEILSEERRGDGARVSVAQGVNGVVVAVKVRAGGEERAVGGGVRVGDGERGGVALGPETLGEGGDDAADGRVEQASHRRGVEPEGGGGDGAVRATAASAEGGHGARATRSAGGGGREGGRAEASRSEPETRGRGGDGGARGARGGGRASDSTGRAHSRVEDVARGTRSACAASSRARACASPARRDARDGTACEWPKFAATRHVAPRR